MSAKLVAMQKPNDAIKSLVDRPVGFLQLTLRHNGLDDAKRKFIACHAGALEARKSLSAVAASAN